jgi:hypothetical protein
MIALAVTPTCLAMFFSNFADLSVDRADYDIHLEHSIILYHRLYNANSTFKQNFSISYKRNSASDYALLCSALSTYGLCCVMKMSIDAAVDRLNVCCNLSPRFSCSIWTH